MAMLIKAGLWVVDSLEGARCWPQAVPGSLPGACAPLHSLSCSARLTCTSLVGCGQASRKKTRRYAGLLMPRTGRVHHGPCCVLLTRSGRPDRVQGREVEQQKPITKKGL